MALDETKLLFNSNWDIDQILLSGQTTVTIPNTAYGTRTLVVDYTTLGLTTQPRVFIAWRTPGENKWNLNGAANNFGGATKLPIFITATNTQLFATNTGAATSHNREIRYIIYKNPGTV